MRDLRDRALTERARKASGKAITWPSRLKVAAARDRDGKVTRHRRAERATLEGWRADGVTWTVHYLPAWADRDDVVFVGRDLIEREPTREERRADKRADKRANKRADERADATADADHLVPVIAAAWASAMDTGERSSVETPAGVLTIARCADGRGRITLAGTAWLARTPRAAAIRAAAIASRR